MDRDTGVMNKELIKKRFTKSLGTYDNNAFAQKIMARKLAEGVNICNYNSVLELGCGTGLLTKLLYNNYKIYDAVDIVPDCEKYILKISDKINFICSDIELYNTDKKYDLIVSNASLQWLENMPEFVNRIYNNLSSGGKFVFTVFGKDNYNEVNNIIKTSLKYYDIDYLKNCFKEKNIESIKEDKIILEFPNPKEILYHMKNTGVNALSNKTWTKKDIIDFEQKYPKNSKGTYFLTYHPIYISLVH